MEDALGVPLFERTGRSLRLTAAGEALMGHAARAFEELRLGLELVSARTPHLLRLHCAPSFAANWLTPRLAHFFEEHPSVEVRLSAGTDYARFDTDEFDADIVYGLPRHQGLVVLPLARETVAPLCSPQMAERVQVPTDLLHLTLIQSETKQVRWPDWFARNGILQPPAPRGSRFDRSFLALAAAANGLGVALESALLAEADLASGRLVAPLRGRSEDIVYVGHHLVHPRTLRQRAPLKVFARWLTRELGLDLTVDDSGQAMTEHR